MRPAAFFGLFILATYCFAQDSLPIFKAEVKSAFVWGEDVSAGAVSSLVKDALTGSEILQLTHAGIAVSSRIGFERRQGQIGEFIAFTTTITNTSNQNQAVKYGETTIDGRIVTPLSVVSGITRPRGKRAHVGVNSVDIAALYCFSSGFLTAENFFPLPQQTGTLTVPAQSSVAVSTVIKDPRYYSLLCSEKGCSPKGTLAYSIQVGAHDFIFRRPGRMLADCGK